MLFASRGCETFFSFWGMFYDFCFADIVETHYVCDHGMADGIKEWAKNENKQRWN